MDLIDEKIKQNSDIIEEILNKWGISDSRAERQKKKVEINYWFHNFERNEFEDALLILQSIQYFPYYRIKSYIETLSKELIRIFNNDLSDVKFFPLGKSSSSSGGFFLYEYRKELGIPESSFPYRSFKNMELSGIRAIVFFDDMIGSGNQAVKFAKNHLKTITINKYYVALLAFKSGLERVKTEACFKEIIVHDRLSEEDKAFSTESQVFPDPNVRQRLERMCRKYGEQLYPKGPLGYDNSQALIVLPHNTPNNTLPIIWAGNKNEKSLGITWYSVWERRKKVLQDHDAQEELRKVLKREESVNLESNDFNESISSLQKLSSIFTGRERELQRFREALNTWSVISIEGLGGIGKTEFALKCIEEFIPRDKVIWFDCSSESKLDALIEISGFSAVIKGMIKTELSKYSGFADLIEKKGKFIFLDNFQNIEDIAFEKFLQIAGRRLRNVKIILISREHPIINAVRVLPIKLLGLGDDSIKYAKLLNEHFFFEAKISNHEIRVICKNLEGHPLAIEFAIQLLQYGETSKNIISKIVKIGDRSKELSHRLLDEIFNHPRSTELEKRFLLNFSVFRGKVDKNAANFIFDGNCLEPTLYKLINKHMIITSEGLYGTHPLVREFCYDLLEDKKKAHFNASEYFKSKRKSQLDPLLEDEIFYHLYHSECFEEMSEIISEKGKGLISLGHTNLLKEKIDIAISKGIERPEFYLFYGDIAQIRGDWKDALSFFEKAFSFSSSDEAISAEAFIKYGEMLFRKGQVKESLGYFMDGYNICKRIHFKRGEARSLNDIGLVYKTFGDLAQAEHKTNEALGISKKFNFKEEIADSLNNLGIIFLYKGDFNEAMDKYHESLKIREEIGDRYGIALYFNNIGCVLEQKGDLNKALDVHNKSLKIRKEIGDKSGIANSLNSIGNILCNKGDFEEAFDNHDKSLEITKEIDDKFGIAKSLILIGNIFYEQGNPDKALDKYNQSLKFFKEIGDKFEIAPTLNNIGNVLLCKKKFKEAQDKYEESLKIQEEIGDKIGIAGTISNIGVFFHHKGDLNKALNKHKESLKIQEEIGDKSGAASSSHNIGSVLFDLRDFDGALDNYNKSLAIREKIGDKPGIASTYHQLGTLFEKGKNYQPSLECFFKSYAIRNKVGLKRQNTTDGIFSVRKTLGFLKFKEIARYTYFNLSEEFKVFLNLEEFLKDNTIRNVIPKVGMNEPCPCGSGKKYKKCCGR